MIGPALALVVLSQAYVRTRVDESDARSQCLWWREKTNIVWRQNEAGSPTVDGDAEFTAITKSFTNWAQVLSSCGSLTLQEGPYTKLRKAEFIEKGDNQNVVLFRTRRCVDEISSGNACYRAQTCGNDYDCWEHAAGAIGVTTTTYDPKTGEVVDADVELNDTRYETKQGFLFTVVDAPTCMQGFESARCVATDIENTVTHEIGHFLGLGHILSPGSTMAPDATLGETHKRTLDEGSKSFICDVYPRGGASKMCVIKTPSSELGTTTCGAGLFAPLALLSWWRRRRR